MTRKAGVRDLLSMRINIDELDYAQRQRYVEFLASLLEEKRIKNTKIAKGISEIVAEEKDKEAAEIEKKHGKVWQCIGRQADPLSPGSIFKFNLQESCSDATDGDKNYDEIFRQIYPAVEPHEAINLSGRTRDSIPNNLEEMEHEAQGRALLNFLGFAYYVEAGKPVLELPDRETLMARWSLLMSKYPDLNQLDILLAEGIADNLKFIMAYFSYDALCSVGVEFVHDMYFHVANTILLIWYSRTAKAYHQAKRQSLDSIIPSYKLLMAYEENIGNFQQILLLSNREIEQLQTSLGLVTDELSARPQPLSKFDISEQKRRIKEIVGVDEEGLRYFIQRKGISENDMITVFRNWDRLSLASERVFNRVSFIDYGNAAFFLREDARNST